MGEGPIAAGPPGTVVVERLAAFTVVPLRVVLTLAHQPPLHSLTLPAVQVTRAPGTGRENLSFLQCSPEMPGLLEYRLVNVFSTKYMTYR